jgi:hypothetical protein
LVSLASGEDDATISVDVDSLFTAANFESMRCVFSCGCWCVDVIGTGRVCENGQALPLIHKFAIKNRHGGGGWWRSCDV